LSLFDDYRSNGSYKLAYHWLHPVDLGISAEQQTKLVGEDEILSTFCESFCHVNQAGLPGQQNLFFLLARCSLSRHVLHTSAVKSIGRLPSQPTLLEKYARSIQDSMTQIEPLLCGT
jgi:hypothetical protein